jgi:hypothetical protein
MREENRDISPDSGKVPEWEPRRKGKAVLTNFTRVEASSTLHWQKPKA